MKLTARGKQVLSLVAAGLTNKEISEGLGIKPETVKCHLKQVMNRLGANNRTHAVVIALGKALIDMPQDND